MQTITVNQEMCNPSLLPACRVLLLERVSLANLPRSPWSKPLHNGFCAAAVRPDFNFELSCSLVFLQVFHVQRFNATLRDRLGL